MKRIVLTAVLGVAVAAVALAQSFVLAKGQGVAVNENRDHMQFRFEVAQRGENDVRGQFNAVAEARDGNARVAINARELRELNGEENRARFVGPAEVNVRTRNGNRTFRGHLLVQVADINHGDGNPDDPQQLDRIHVVFQANESDFSFEFGGIVPRGDIVVRTGDRDRDRGASSVDQP